MGRDSNQLALGRATAAFREAVGQPGIAAAFDAEFGAPPASGGSRAA
ncbi:hypothetical protein ABZX75_26235 [Streptomyces sp. NPDC003038]